MLRSVGDSLGSFPLLGEGEAACRQGVRQLSPEAGEEGTANDSLHNIQCGLYKGELRRRDLLDVEEHFLCCSPPLREDRVNVLFLTGDLGDKDEES